MSARDDILKKLNKKTEQYKKYRLKAAGKLPVRQLIKDLLESLEQAHATSKNGVEYGQAVHGLIASFYHSVYKIDSSAKVHLRWNNEDNAENWEDLRCTGVHIIWGDIWKNRNPQEEGELCVGVENLWLEDL